MPQRLSIGATVFLVLTVLVGLYFAYAAVQGPSGILRRIQIRPRPRICARPATCCRPT